MADIQFLGRNIRKFREDKNMTQSELAEALFVSFQAVSAWERGLSVPDLENTVRLAALFNVSMDALLTSTDVDVMVGIDGGGSKTEFILFQTDGTVLKKVQLEGSNPNDKGLEKCLDVLERGLTRLLNGIRPKIIFGGISGVTVGNYIELIESFLKEHFGCDVKVDTDAANVLSLAPDPESSGAVICGTGSCVFVRKNNKLCRVGGWGQLFDKAGSAYDIGRDAICLTLAVYDGLEEPCLLSSLVEEKIEGTVWEKLSHIYDKGRAYIATFANLVVQAAEKGDKKAEKILLENASRLAYLIKASKEKYNGKDYVAAGGFFHNVSFKEMVEEKAGIKLYSSDLPPVYGACVEALRHSKIAVTVSFYEKFNESYRRLSC